MENPGLAWWAQWVLMALALLGILAMFLVARYHENKIRQANEKKIREANRKMLDGAVEVIGDGLRENQASPESVHWLIEKVITAGHLPNISAGQLAEFISAVYQGDLSLGRNHWLMVVEHAYLTMDEADRAEWMYKFKSGLCERSYLDWRDAVGEFLERRE